MTADEMILEKLRRGDWTVDVETGQLFTIKGSGGKVIPKTEIGKTNQRGYKVVHACCGKVKASVRVHRVIWIATHGQIEKPLMPDHKNRMRADNKIINLHLVTAKGNAQNKPSVQGEANPAAKLDIHKVNHIRSMRGMKVRDIAKLVDVSKSQVWNILSGKSWNEPGNSGGDGLA